ncbi:hypothetical protein [Carboxylicivirga sp. N1Y90]|uniref:hypothetical protein n=1 Tax=Carboxylicivirga fragile TaxID=3417571 RepID=UPI003D34D91F|nr:hypothetical protein [Marinilabiliaceae bacterium N1Y90]
MKKIAIYLSILFVIGLSLGGNANASGHDIITEVDDNSQGGGGCVRTTTCDDGMCVVSCAKNRFLARGCKYNDAFVCTVQKVDVNIGL